MTAPTFEAMAFLNSATLARSSKPPDALLSGQTTSPQCGLLLLAHVPKTGGSTVSEVLQSLPGWEFLGRPTSGHPRFFAAFGSLFVGTPAFSWRGLPADCLRRAPNASARRRLRRRAPWRRRACDPSRAARAAQIPLERRAAPQQIEAKYQEAGCPMQSSVILREPSSQMLEFLCFRRCHSHLQQNATTQEIAPQIGPATFAANPQLAWLRGRTYREFGAIFLCRDKGRAVWQRLLFFQAIHEFRW